MLAACLPLFLPTGFCLCHLGLEHHAVSLTTDSESETPHDHAPGCPGSHGADQLKWIEPLEISTLAQPPVELLVLIPLTFQSPTIPLPREHEGPWPSAPPLFLTNCSFVI